jgi:hypothetical protein
MPCQQCHALAKGLQAGQVFSNKTDHHDITEILLKVALNITHNPNPLNNWNVLLLPIMQSLGQGMALLTRHLLFW